MIEYLEKDCKKELGSERTLVDFYADWCGPCRMMGTILENVKNIRILKVNVDKFPQIAQEFNVMSIPNLVLFDKGIPVKSHVGFMNEDDLLEFLK